VTTPSFRVQLDVVSDGYDGKMCWVQPRAGTIPPGAGGNALPVVVLTMQKLLLAGSDVFYALQEMRTDDLGKTWSGPVCHESTLGRRKEPGGIEAVICDATPKWHAATGKLLLTGHVARYVGDKLMPDPRPRQTAYSVYDPLARVWAPWDTLAMPDSDTFYNAGAGSVQRYDLSDGRILLPIYFKSRTEAGKGWNGCHNSTVCRCEFDGQKLRYVEHGDTLVVSEPRGLGEPSLTRFDGKYYLTLRNDVRGYVATSDDGLHFGPPRPWTFDDGSELGNYNTQQHWVTHSDGLFLTYTRRGLNNDYVFRHRAPLLIAQVDADRLCVLRHTERELMPNRGARYGNFAVTDVSPNETWVTESEWMQPLGCEKYGSNGRVYASRILWDSPNRLIG